MKWAHFAGAHNIKGHDLRLRLEMGQSRELNGDRDVRVSVSVDV